MPRIEEVLPKERKRDDPVRRLEQINEILKLELDKGYLVETNNFASWKTYFYAEKRKQCPKKEFTFRSEIIDNEKRHKVWRIK